jgi:hypothetical protein
MQQKNISHLRGRKDRSTTKVIIKLNPSKKANGKAKQRMETNLRKRTSNTGFYVKECFLILQK